MGQCLQFLKRLCDTVLSQIWYTWGDETPQLISRNYRIIGQVKDSAFNNNIYRCCRRDDDRILVVFKEIVVPVDNKAEFEGLLNYKVSFHHMLPHPCVARMLYKITTEHHCYLGYECFPDDLSSKIAQPKNLRDPMIKRTFHQILSAVAHYHYCDIEIGDIKPKYLQMTINGDIKLADFGFAAAGGDSWTTYPIKTSRYSAPELLFVTRKYSKAADMWSVGCIFGEMVTGQPVFQGKTPREQMMSIFRLLGTPTEESWPRVADICSRTTFSSFPRFEPVNLGEKFVGFEAEGIDLLSRMLRLDRRTRISAAEALGHDYFNGFNEIGITIG